MPKVTKIAATEQLARLQRVVAYARVSSGKDAMLHSLAAQVDQYSRMIQTHPGWQYVGVYADEATTGTKDERAEFQRLLEDCRAGKIDMVITKSISRFARNTVILLTTVRELKTIGVDVYFEEQNIHSVSSEGELMLTILASFAQEESRSVSDNCKWSIREHFKKGEPAYLHCYGYRWYDNQLHIHPDEALVVRQIFDDYLKGMGLPAIAKKLNEAGIPAREGGTWRTSSLNYILRNERYIGDLLLQKVFVADHVSKKRMKNCGELPQYYVTDAHTPIISREMFEAVQREIVNRQLLFGNNHTIGTVYPFSKRIVCGICGASYRRKITASSTKYSKPVWICSTYNSKGKHYCASKQIPEDILMETTAKVMGIDLFDEDAFSEMIEQLLVTGPNQLRYTFTDGTEHDVVWEDHSRRSSWTPEMREKAAEKARKGRR